MSAVKRSITLPEIHDQWVLEQARATAKAKGRANPNFSEVIADLIVEKRNSLPAPEPEKEPVAA
jgi:hypothetical protein